MKKTLIVALAAAVAIALSPLPDLRAAPFAPGSQSAGDHVQPVQAKKKTKKAKKKRGKKKKKAKGKKVAAAKSCGTFKYRKGGKCVDARDKK
jgi:hypothetical protein